MGKRQIGELQPLELVITIMISDLATLPMEDVNRSLYDGIIPCVTLMFIELILTFFSLKIPFFRALVSGKPSIIIRNGKIDVSVMKKTRLNIDDLFEQLRSNGYTSVDEVSFAVLETNGHLSVVPKTFFAPLSQEILKNPQKNATMHRNIIKDGVVCKNNLKALGLNEEWLFKRLKEEKISSPRKVFIFTTDGENHFIQKK
jgi:uncharacterized membrane protein YcaP (DUF421 family)